MPKTKEKPKEKPETRMPCPKCWSTLTYIRIKTGERVCRSCGKTSKVK